MLKIKSNKNSKKSWMSNRLELGTLVRPKKKIYLTPMESDYETSDWPEWHPHQLGIVIPAFEGTIGINVMTPSGSGLCFVDEVYCV